MTKRVVGDKFGKLTLVSKAGYPGSGHSLYFNCICDCGNFCTVRSSRLNSTSSCGCDKNRREDLTGKVFKDLFVVKLTERKKRYDMWECRCSCGNVVVKSTPFIKYGRGNCGHDISLGTHRHDTREGKSPEYTAWDSMVQRCTNPNCAEYHRYGGAGITVCDRWLISKGGNFENFLEDMGKRPDGLSLDRIDGTKGYSPDNCRWATPSLQAYNQKIRCTNTSGKTGVSWNRRNKKWEAQITVDRKLVHLGLFLSLEAAIQKRKDAEIKYFGFNKE